MIERNIYLEKLTALKDKQLIKVITGIRRCGKSTMFKLYQIFYKFFDSVFLLDSVVLALIFL